MKNKVMRRRDGTPYCYVCRKKLEGIIKLREMRKKELDYTKEYESLQHKITDTIVTISAGNGLTLYRHKDKCNPGTERYLNSPAGKNFIKNHF